MEQAELIIGLLAIIAILLGVMLSVTMMRLRRGSHHFSRPMGNSSSQHAQTVPNKGQKIRQQGGQVMQPPRVTQQEQQAQNTTHYNQYIRSERWKELRELALQRAQFKCELCGNPYSAVHHIKYPANYDTDTLENVLVVCETCHEKLHGLPDSSENSSPQHDVFSTKFSGQNHRRYFFDVKPAQNNAGRYLKITESKQRDRGFYEYYRVMIFEEDMPRFYTHILEAMQQFHEISPDQRPLVPEKASTEYANAYMKWTDSDDRELREKFQQGMSIPDLSKHFRRKPGAIRSRLQKLNIIK